MAIDAQTEKITTIQKSASPGCLIQALWFVFIGWWLGALSIAAAWFLNITLIGLPLGMAILNNIPRILSIQPPKKEYQVIQSNGKTVVAASSLPQRNFLLRAVYFILIGWWWSAIWLVIAYLLCITVLLIPLSLQMFRLTPFMTTLKRY